MDSAVTLAEARAAGFSPRALSFDYGQRLHCELEAARRVLAAQGSPEQRVVRIDLQAIGGSALTAEIEVPKLGQPGDSIPVTYVPARNTIFLSVALGWAEVLGARDLFIGVNAVDYSGYPDCRPEFLQAFERLASLATAAGVESGACFQVHAPLLKLSKAEIVLRAEELGVDLGLTHSCYDPIQEEERWLSCGRCDACRLRLQGFAEAQREDPIVYIQKGRV